VIEERGTTGEGMAYDYAVLGGGRQGTAAAYDMARWGDAERVLIADISLDAAQKSAARVNGLIGSEVAKPVRLDVTDHGALVAFLGPVDSFLSAVPYWNNPGITDAARSQAWAPASASTPCRCSMRPTRS